MSSSRRDRLNRFLATSVVVERIVGGSVLNRDGQVVYSSDRRLIGRRAAFQDRWLSQTLAGRIVSRVGSGENGDGRVLQTYLPITLGGTRVSGVVALEQPYGPIAASARRTALLIAGVLEALLLLLVVTLVPVLSRASSRLGRQIEELDYVATHDQLMGLPNRLGFQRALEQVSRQKKAASLLLVDLDGFHEVNDTLGSGSGDSLLVQWADRLRPESIGCDLVARLGEDELGILVTGNTAIEVEALVARVRSAQLEPANVASVRVALEASIGAALIPEHGSDFDTLLRRAGLALSTAKHTPDRYALYSPDDEKRGGSELSRTAELRDALEQGQFEVHYQPQADLATRAIRGVEALLRWRHPSEGLLDAEVFIEHAERSGLIADLDRFVLGQAAQQWQHWDNLGIRIDIAVNLAAADLLDTQLPNEIATLLTAFTIPAHHLILEVTERSILRTEQRTHQVLERLGAIGVQLSIDDYGTGYSSLSYLHQLPFRQVKIDHSFIDHLAESSKDKAIVRSTTELAHTLGATVVAEGIERPEQFIAAATHGCDIAQGYLISDPLSAEDTTALLTTRPGPNSSRRIHHARATRHWMELELAQPS